MQYGPSSQPTPATRRRTRLRWIGLVLFGTLSLAFCCGYPILRVAAGFAECSALNRLVHDTGCLRRLTSGAGPMVVLPDGSQVVLGWDTTIEFYRFADGTLVQSLTGHTDAIADLALSGAGDLLASASRDGTVSLWQTANGTRVHTLDHAGVPVEHVALTDDGTLVATGTSSGTVTLWHTHDGHPLRTLVTYPAMVAGLAFTPDGTTLVATATDGTLQAWNVVDGTLQHTFHPAPPDVAALALAPDGTKLATTSEDDATVRIWSFPEGQLLQQVTGTGTTQGGGDGLIAFSPTSDLLAADDSGYINVWRIADATHIAHYVHITHAEGLAWMPTEPLLISNAGHPHMFVQVWELP